MAGDETYEDRKEATWHEFQIHEEHRCMLRVIARRLNPPLTEEELLRLVVEEVPLEPMPPIPPEDLNKIPLDSIAEPNVTDTR